MKNKKVQAIIDYKGLCFKCLSKNKPIDTFYISNRGYGSGFDNEDTKIQLCKDCQSQDIDKWFNENPTMNDWCEDYKYENNIYEFIETLPLEGQELFQNTCSSDGYRMKAQDYIDMKLGILPDKKYKEYGMYSPSEKKAYEERFPTCEYPINRIWDDDSKGCVCPFGVSGEYGQVADEDNISEKCYYCKYYKNREITLKTIDADDFSDYKLYMQSKLRMTELEAKFGNL